jgi:hypothetical protein
MLYIHTQSYTYTYKHMHKYLVRDVATGVCGATIELDELSKVLPHHLLPNQCSLAGSVIE